MRDVVHRDRLDAVFVESLHGSLYDVVPYFCVVNIFHHSYVFAIAEHGVIDLSFRFHKVLGQGFIQPQR